MPVANGREFLMIPGPTTVPDRVLGAMHRPAIDIYAGPLVEITNRCLADLRRIFGTRHRTYIYAANGHGAWEAALTNTLSRGEKVLVLESGRFAVNWGLMGEFMGLDIEILAGDWHAAVDLNAVAERLKADTAGEIRAVLVAQVDTATGVVNDVAALRTAMKTAGHPALLMVDAVASLGTTPFELDAWDIDVAVSGSQKGLMTPPGLSFVAAGPRALAAARHANLKTQYWDWEFRDGEQHYEKYCGTPPEHHLFALREALDMILEEGLENVFDRHARLAGAARAAIESWSKAGVMEFAIADASARSNSLTVALMANGRSDDLIACCRDQYGVMLGGCFADWKGKGFRIGHMGHINAPMLLGALGAIESALISLDIPLGDSGSAAAARSLAESHPEMTIEDMFSLAGRRALVTGGSRGIGKAAAAVLGMAGAEVIITARDEAELAQARDDLSANAGGAVHMVVTDHADWTGSGAVIEKIDKTTGGIDILVNNAGTGLLRSVEDMTDAEWSNILNLNLSAPMALIRAALPHMKAQKWGRIINISSLFAQVGKEHRSAYSASKGGLEAMTRTLAVELAPHNITVNAVGAGPIRTGLTIGRWNDPDEHRRLAAMTALNRWGEPEDVAGLVLGLAAGTGGFITGQCLLVDGGASAM